MRSPGAAPAASVPPPPGELAENLFADLTDLTDLRRPRDDALTTETAPTSTDFIREIVAEDLASGKHTTIVTRFPPEPNGYLHIGHAKSICLNFGVALENGGRCNLRFDDTNPTTEDMEYVAAIQEDIRWLGFEWDGLHYASDYFGAFYRYAEELVAAGKAYVCSLSEEEIRRYRGTVTEPGTPSPYRGRSVEESLDLLRRMRAGEFPDGTHVLRAKIDMASPNMKMRDPLLYRIRRAAHYRTGSEWCIYPMYDWAHPLSDAIEGITHSLCTLEFENNRELYDWVVENTSVPSRPRQIEFARLSLTSTLMSKRKLLQLVRERLVSGWDDPRMPTLSGLRRRGYTPEAIRDFADRIGVAKANSTVDMALLEHSVRDDLNRRAPRVLCVVEPLRVVVENYPEGESEELEAPYWPHDVGKAGSRKLPFSRVLYIERDDFREKPPKRFHRLAPGWEVRLRYAYLIRCTGVVKDPESGEVVELRCTYDPATRGGTAPDGRKVKGTIHWVSAAHSVPVEVRLYDRLFSVERPDLEADTPLSELVDPGSCEVVTEARIEPSVRRLAAGDGEPAVPRFQFERHGYFFLDPQDSSPERLVFNRIVSLRDTWAKVAAAAAAPDRAGAQRLAAVEEEAVEKKGAGRAPAARRDPLAGLDAGGRERFGHLREEHGLDAGDARILAEDPSRTALLDEAVAAGARPQAAANWIVNDLLRELKERQVSELPFGGAALGELVALIEEGTISATLGKRVFTEMLAGGGRPREIVERQGLEQVSDPGELVPRIDEVLAAHPDEVAAYRGGKEQLFGFFVGQVMRATRGKADPGLVNRLLRQRLGGA